MLRVGDKSFQRSRRVLRDFVHICGPMVEIENERLVFVHFSAKELVARFYRLCCTESGQDI